MRLLACIAPVLLALAARADVAARPPITGLSHVALWVADLGASRAFYEGYLGFGEPYRLTSDGGAVQIAWVKVNDRQSIELFPLAGTAPRDGDNLYHVAFETDDAQALLDYLRAQGVHAPGGKALPERAPRGRIGNLNYFTEDPDGHIIEFTQYLPGGWTRAHAGSDMPATRISPRISHAGITVAHLEASLHFYRDILGFRETWRGTSDGKTLSWVNLRVPEGSDYIELMLVGAKPDAGRLHILHHLCLEVADARAAEATLRARAMPPSCKAPSPLKTGVNGKRQVNEYDPDGTRVEVMEAATADGRPVPPSSAPPPS